MHGIPLYLGLVYVSVGQTIEMEAEQMSLGRTLGPSAQTMYDYLRHRIPLQPCPLSIL